MVKSRAGGKAFAEGAEDDYARRRSEGVAGHDGQRMNQPRVYESAVFGCSIAIISGEFSRTIRDKDLDSP
jgi:hypothetical protein